MILLKGERHAQLLTGAGGDDIILAFDLPAGSVLQGFKADVHVIGTSVALERETAVGYALAAYLIEVQDPDSVTAYDTIWDRFVSKYTLTDTIDLDTANADNEAFWEPGEGNFEEVFDMGDQPMRLYMRRKMLTFADPGNMGLRFQPSETPFEPQWFPADRVFVSSRKKVRIKKPSVLLIGHAQPGYGTTTTSRTHLTENEWGRIQYVEQTLQHALIDQLNVVETGAETPWEDASVLLRKHLAPSVFEAQGASFLTQDWNIFATLQFRHTVPGSMAFKSVDLTP